MPRRGINGVPCVHAPDQGRSGCLSVKNLESSLFKKCSHNVFSQGRNKINRLLPVHVESGVNTKGGRKCFTNLLVQCAPV